MASLGSIMRGIGRGARAVGRGAMKGVLGFDDRDIMGKRKAKPPEEPDGDEINPEYSGYSKGPMMLPEVESDGLVEEMEMEAPPDIGMAPEEALIGLEMPVLPGMSKRRGGKGGPPAVPKGRGKMVDMASADFGALTGGAAASPKEFPPSAYDMPRKTLPPGFAPETAPSAGQKPQFDIDLMEAQRKSGGDDPRYPKSMSPEAEYRAGQVMGLGAELMGGAALGKLLGAVPGLMRGRQGTAAAANKFMNSVQPGGPTGLAAKVPVGGKVPMASGPIRPPLLPTTGYTSPVGKIVGTPPMPRPPAGPGKAAIEARLNAFRRTHRPSGPDDFFAPGGKGSPMPGVPGVEGPMPWIPGTQLTREGRILMKGPNNQMGWELLP